MVLFELFFILSVFTISVFCYFKSSYKYWTNKNLFILPPSIPFGNAPNPYTLKEAYPVYFANLYKKVKASGHKHCGLYIFTNPYYFVLDLDYIKNILTRDFEYFSERGIYFNEKDDPIGAHLFAIGGSKWRNLRKKFTPIFTPNKIRIMFHTLMDCVVGLQETLEINYENNQPVNVKELCICYTMDVIGHCGFGLNLNSFKQENSAFRKYGTKVFQFSRFRVFLACFTSAYPGFCRRIGMRQVSEDIGNFFIETVSKSVKYREDHGISRDDFLQLLIDLKNSEEGLSMNELIAQAFIFFLGGFETSATTMTFALYELAKNQNIQDKVRSEILDKTSQDFGYDAVQELKYLNQIVEETLRKYPPLSFINRQATKDYKVPGEDLVIEKGTAVFISVLGIHHDERYYPDPEKFDPERFNEENRHKIKQYSYLPFGEGPRSCIGGRFGLLQAKVGIASILKNYKVKINRKTKEPLKMDIKSVTLSAEGNVWLDFEKM